MNKTGRHILRGLLLVSIALLLLGGSTGCSFKRIVGNQDVRTMDLSFVKIGETKWMDVMKTLGPPVPLGTQDDSRRNISDRHLRYGCFEGRFFKFALPLDLVLPFTWGENINVVEILFELDEDGYVTQVTRTKRDMIWMPFERERRREAEETLIISKEGVNVY